MFFDTKLVSKACMSVWSGCWLLPFPTKSTVDKQASPQTQEGRPAPSAHLCNMETFHHWWSKAHTDTYGLLESHVTRRPLINSRFPISGVNKQRRWCNTEVEAAMGRRSTAPLTDPPDSTWIKANGGTTCTGPSRRCLTRALYSIIPNYASRWQGHILRRSNVGDRL